MIGIDIVEIDRIDKMIKNYGKRFIERIFTEKEIEEWEKRGNLSSILAGKFAAKEALIKATTENLRWKDIEIIKENKPIIKYKNKIAAVSISHTKNIAVAVVIINEFNKKNC